MPVRTAIVYFVQLHVGCARMAVVDVNATNYSHAASSVNAPNVVNVSTVTVLTAVSVLIK